VAAFGGRGNLPSQVLAVDPAVVAAMRGNAATTARNGLLNDARQIGGVSTADWLGPLQPLSPFAPQGTGYRTWDYPVGINIRYQPRQEGPMPMIGFDELRFFARNVDLIRIIMENRKQQLQRQNWQFTLRNGQEGDDDPRIQMLNKFFEVPDPIGGVDFNSWLNIFVEEMMVIDAPTCFIHRDENGKPVALRHVDGSTIKLLIGLDGAQPQPPSPAYQQIIHGVPIVDLDKTQLFYYPRNQRPDFLYGYSPVEMCITTLNLWMRREIFRIQWYTEANVPAGLLEAPAGITNEEIKDLQVRFNASLQGNTAERWNLLWVPPGTKYTEIKPPTLADQLDEWCAQIFCYCFGVPPTPFMARAMATRANAESTREQSAEEGLAPLIAWVAAFVTRLVWWGWGWDDIKFGPVFAKATDPAIQANIHKTYLSMGALNINEVRDDLGREPIGPAGDVYRIYESSGPIPLESVDDMADANLQNAQAGAQAKASPPAQSGNAPAGANAQDNPPPTQDESPGKRAKAGTRSGAALAEKAMRFGGKAGGMDFGQRELSKKKAHSPSDLTPVISTRVKPKPKLRVL